MNKYSILLNNDMSKLPVGFILLNETQIELLKKELNFSITGIMQHNKKQIELLAVSLNMNPIVVNKKVIK